jgi:Cu/Ag efflux pump CusA
VHTQEEFTQLLPLDVAEAVVSWRQGRLISQILEGNGRVIDIVLAGPESFQSLSSLRELPIETPTSGMVPLSMLATIDQIPTPASVKHEGGERRLSIGASPEGSKISAIVEAIRHKLSTEVELPKGYRVEIGGEAIARSEAATSLLLTGALILVGIFALLSMAFRSPGHAGIVLLNLPLGLIGGMAAAFFNSEGLSVAGFVGFITLFGIISRNGIMLVAHKLHIDAEHPEIDAAERVFLAAEERLLPILMTAATAGLGLLPLVLSFESAGSELEAPMALIVLSGLVSSTALNMVVLPTFYIWLAKRKKSPHSSGSTK